MPTQRIHDMAGQMEQEVPIPANEMGSPEHPWTSQDEAALQDAFATTGEEEEPASDVSPEFSAAINRLRRLGSRRTRLRAELDDVERELLGEAIVDAFRVGVPKRVIAKESQVVRQTVYNVIARA